MDDSDGSFTDFVVRQQEPLLRLAFLLAGDRGHAEDLAAAAWPSSPRRRSRWCARTRGTARFLAEFPADDGIVVVPFPLDTASVAAITDGGVSLGRVGLLAHSADFGD